MEEADYLLNQLRSEHPSASHHCHALRVDPIKTEEFCSDDGEPGGTAGLPILNQLKSAALVNAVLVVVRYFGGVKLGKPGLIEAYGESAGLAIKSAELKPILSCRILSLSYQYPQQSVMDQLEHELQLKEVEAHYTEIVRKKFAVPIDHYPETFTRFKVLNHLFFDLCEEGGTCLIL